MIATIATPIAWEHHYGYFYVGCVYFLALHLGPVTKSFYAFVACFLVMANSWRFLDGLAATRWSALLSYDLFAGLAMILLVSFSARAVSETANETEEPGERLYPPNMRLEDLHQLRPVIGGRAGSDL
jgi:hypothetical protein